MFKGCRCGSGISLFVMWRVTWQYAYSPFNRPRKKFLKQPNPRTDLEMGTVLLFLFRSVYSWFAKRLLFHEKFCWLISLNCPFTSFIIFFSFFTGHMISVCITWQEYCTAIGWSSGDIIRTIIIINYIY